MSRRRQFPDHSIDKTLLEWRDISRLRHADRHLENQAERERSCPQLSTEELGMPEAGRRPTPWSSDIAACGDAGRGSVRGRGAKGGGQMDTARMGSRTVTRS